MGARPQRAVFICEKGIHVSAIARELISKGWECSAITRAGSSLTRVAGLEKLNIIEKNQNFMATVLANYHDLLFSSDFISFSSDDHLGEVAQSSLSTLEKEVILPISNDVGLSMMASKVGFTRAIHQLGLRTPRTEIYQSPDELIELSQRFPLPAIAKADAGGGGVSVLRLDTPLTSTDGLRNLAPGVIQEFFNNQRIGVEALFNNGRLAAWMYCDEQETIAPFAPSMVRHYGAPLALDFVEQLQTLGEATGAHGFANCSFFYSPDEKAHYIFECDLRANHWARLFPYFGIDVAALLAPSWSGEIATPKLSRGGKTVIHFSRLLTASANKRDGRAFIRTLLRYRNSSDFLAGEGRFFAVAAPIALKFLPERIKPFLKSLRRYI